MSSGLPSDCARRYRADRPLASGGFGAVWLAHHIELDRPAAIKVMHGTALTEPDTIERFLAEGRITSQLNHPHIVRVYDQGLGDAIPWIAYELLQGGTLAQAAEAGTLTAAAAVQAVAQVARALEAAHAKGILHRDIKPQNVIEAEPGVYKVADFGIATWQSDRQIHTKTGVVLGTPTYLAPELVMGKPASPASDIYALSVMLHELLAGAPPFDADNPIAMLEHHLRSVPPSLATIDPTLPPALCRLVLDGLCKMPSGRPASAAAFAEVLESLEGLALGAPSSARRPSAPAPVASTSASSTQRRTSGATRALPSGATRRRTASTRVSNAVPAPGASAARSRLSPARAAVIALALAILIGLIVLMWPRPAPAPVRSTPASAPSSPSPAQPAPASTASPTKPPLLDLTAGLPEHLPTGPRRMLLMNYRALVSPSTKTRQQLGKIVLDTLHAMPQTTGSDNLWATAPVPDSDRSMPGILALLAAALEKGFTPADTGVRLLQLPGLLPRRLNGVSPSIEERACISAWSIVALPVNPNAGELQVRARIHQTMLLWLAACEAADAPAPGHLAEVLRLIAALPLETCAFPFLDAPSETDQFPRQARSLRRICIHTALRVLARHDAPPAFTVAALENARRQLKARTPAVPTASSAPVDLRPLIPFSEVSAKDATALERLCSFVTDDTRFLEAATTPHLAETVRRSDVPLARPTRAPFWPRYHAAVTRWIDQKASIASALPGYWAARSVQRRPYNEVRAQHVTMLTESVTAMFHALDLALELELSSNPVGSAQLCAYAAVNLADQIKPPLAVLRDLGRSTAHEFMADPLPVLRCAAAALIQCLARRAIAGDPVFAEVFPPKRVAAFIGRETLLRSLANGPGSSDAGAKLQWPVTLSEDTDEEK